MSSTSTGVEKTRKTKKIKAKQRHRIMNSEQLRVQMLEFLANPDNNWPSRTDLATKILKYSSVNSLYQRFSVDELAAIENEALALRRARLAKDSSDIDKALIKKAKTGKVSAAKLYYQRLEGWTPATQVRHAGADGGELPALLPAVAELVGRALAIQPVEIDAEVITIEAIPEKTGDISDG